MTNYTVFADTPQSHPLTAEEIWGAAESIPPEHRPPHSAPADTTEQPASEETEENDDED